MYISTRSRAPSLGFADVTLTGLASDGGLYVPDSCPVLDMDALTGLSYLDVAQRVMAPFVGADIPPADLKKILSAAYGVFDNGDVAPLRRLTGNHALMELFHGPTLAFKDVALQFLGQVFDYILAHRKQRVTIVGATSGDTGSAAIEAFKGKDSADIFILHPQGRVSDVQRRQMTTVPDANVHNIAVEGSFDDCQDIVKALLSDQALREKLNLSAVNSINWSRILAQVVYYVHASLRVRAETGKKTTFCVPTGNFGNVYAGYIARAMGAPVERLIVATNRNDILHRFFQSGVMKAEGVAPTLSPSMDIQISSNFERVLFDLLDRDGAGVERALRQFRETGAFMLDAATMEKLRAVFSSGRRDNAQILETIRDVHTRHCILIDPHTAVGVGAAEEYMAQHPDAQVVTLATAHPAKFPDAVRQATGIAPELPPRLAAMEGLPERCHVLPADAARVKEWVLAKARQKG